MQTKQAITKKLALPADQVWEALRAIGGLDRWFPIIDSCRVEGAGVGAVREMTLVGGGDITDVIDSIDEAAMRLVYLRPRSPFPVSSYRGTVEVFRSYDGSAVVAWTIDFESRAEDATAVAELVQGAISDGIEGLERDLIGAGD